MSVSKRRGIHVTGLEVLTDDGKPLSQVTLKCPCTESE